MNLFKGEKFYCPVCKCYFIESKFLRLTIKDEKSLWIANMVTHFRHSHIQYWNCCWGNGGRAYRAGWFKNYRAEKKKVNNICKRKIIRKCYSFLLEMQINRSHFEKLQFNDKETLKLLKAKLDNNILTLNYQIPYEYNHSRTA